MNDFHYIAIEGVLGVGKTSFAKQLAQDLSAKLVLEEVDNNPFLDRFYKDMKGHALQTQLFFLLSRARQQEPLSQMDLFSRRIVADYLIEKDRIFAYVTLDENELALYEKIFSVVVNEGKMLKPDLVVYLQASVEILLERIKRRGRVFEKNIPKDYIHNLTQAYNHYFSHFTGCPLVIVNTDDVDFVNDRTAYKNIKDFIMSVKGGINYYTPRKG
ncbi:MAG TPA: deoxynucleoside kinase [Candidatus Goldiibacteriota bacterium]|nr:deoxynucleoside kinase [Candidatus Goldiibacteriota bacterium]